MVCDKVIGTELLGLWQVIFFSTSKINKLQPLLFPITNFKFVNGINSFSKFNTTVLPETVRAIHYSAEFIGNCNYTVWLVSADVLIGLIVYLLAEIWLKYDNNLEKLGKRIMKEYFIMVVSFNTLNICYSAGLQFTYGKQQPILNIAVTVACLCLPLAASMMILFDKNLEDYR
jgi:hypothetical protein